VLWKLVAGRMPKRESHYHAILAEVIKEGVSEAQVEFPSKSTRSVYMGLRNCQEHSTEFAHLSVHIRCGEVWIRNEKGR